MSHTYPGPLCEALNWSNEFRNFFLLRGRGVSKLVLSDHPFQNIYKAHNNLTANASYPQKKKEKDMIEVYTDGGCRITKDSRHGAIGVIINDGDSETVIRKSYRRTNSNRMFLMAVVVALESIEDSNQTIIIYSESTYVVDSIMKGWLDKWIKKGQERPNMDLWRRILDLTEKYSGKIRYQWVKTESGNEFMDRCDGLVRNGFKSCVSEMLIDEIYELENVAGDFSKFTIDELLGLIVKKVGIPIPVYSYDYRKYVVSMPKNISIGDCVTGIMETDMFDSFKEACICILNWQIKMFGENSLF